MGARNLIKLIDHAGSYYGSLISHLLHSFFFVYTGGMNPICQLPVPHPFLPIAHAVYDSVCSVWCLHIIYYVVFCDEDI